MPRRLLGGSDKARAEWRVVHRPCLKQQCDLDTETDAETDAETEKQESGQKRNAEAQEGAAESGDQDFAQRLAAVDKRVRFDVGKWKCINCVPFPQRTAANPVSPDDPTAFDPDAVGDGQCQFRTPANTNCRVEFTVKCSVCRAVCCTLLHGRAVESSPSPPLNECARTCSTTRTPPTSARRARRRCATRPTVLTLAWAAKRQCAASACPATRVSVGCKAWCKIVAQSVDQSVVHHTTTSQVLCAAHHNVDVRGHC
jgi:hypothetical protein